MNAIQRLARSLLGNRPNAVKTLERKGFTVTNEGQKPSLMNPGEMVGPSLYHLIALLGKETVVSRLERACSFVQA